MEYNPSDVASNPTEWAFSQWTIPHVSRYRLSVVPNPGATEATPGRAHKRNLQIQLRAFQPQQHLYTLLELELPRLLAPDLPSNRYSSVCIRYRPLHLEAEGRKNTIFRRCLAICLHWAICAPAADRSHGCRFSGTLSGIEPQSSVTRQRQGSPLHYLLPDRWCIRPTPHQYWRFRYIGLRQQLHLPVKAVVFVPANSILDPTPWFPKRWLDGQGLIFQVLAARLGQLSRRKARMPSQLGRL